MPLHSHAFAHARQACTAALTLCALSLPCMADAVPKRVALLIGVGQYDDPKVPTLEGPPHDVAALREVLLRRWGFQPQDVVTLLNGQASRANIVKGLAALAQRSGNGDEVLVYFSGHGTSAFDSANSLPVPHGSGAFVPADFALGKSGLAGLIVGRTDLVPVFTKLEQGGRRLWVVSDSCYSGQAVRSLAAGRVAALPERMVPMLVSERDRLGQANDLALADKAAPPPAYPYRATMYLAAASEGERARDIPAAALKDHPTVDGKPHGAMTDALLRVLEGKVEADLNGDGVLSLDEVQRATASFMDSRAYGHSALRLPAVAEDVHGLGGQPVLGARNVAAKAFKLAGVPPLRVRLENVGPDLWAAVAAVPDVVLAPGGTPADIVLRQIGGRLGVLAASGDPLATMAAGDTVRALAQVRQLAWARRLRGLAERHRRGVLPTEIDPALFGGNFTIGKTVSFVVRPDKAAVIVLVNINSDGKVSVLYPANQSEAQPKEGGQAMHIPGSGESQRIRVQEPLGMDMQFHFGFDQAPPGLGKLFGLDGVDPDDARLRAFVEGIAGMDGKFTFATTHLRTLPK